MEFEKGVKWPFLVGFSVMAQTSNGLLYVYGEWILQEWHKKVNGEEARKIDVVYMIGDNPASDIQGTMNYKSRYGAEWKSVLVESGVYTKEERRRPQYEPTAFAHTVRDAVELVLKVEGWRESIDTERGDVDM
jgi:ribonucleotide monophosphatase NagD (HAD superfamily)